MDIRYRLVQIVTPRFKEEDDITYRVEYLGEDNYWRCYTGATTNYLNMTKEDAHNLFEKLCFEADPKNQPTKNIVNVYPVESV